MAKRKLKAELEEEVEFWKRAYRYLKKPPKDIKDLNYIATLTQADFELEKEDAIWFSPQSKRRKACKDFIWAGEGLVAHLKKDEQESKRKT